MLSIAAVTEFGEEYKAFILPGDGLVIEAEAARKNGYTPELWAERGARDLLTVALEFSGWLDWARNKHDLDHWGLGAVAHNAGFDKGFTEWMGRMTGCDFGLDRRWECSQGLLGAFMRSGVFPDCRSSSLDSLCKITQIKGRAEEHDALWDARACLKGYVMLLGLLHGFAAAFREEAAGAVEGVAVARPATLEFVRKEAVKVLSVESGFDEAEPEPQVGILAEPGKEPGRERLGRPGNAEEWEHEYKLEGVASLPRGLGNDSN